MTEKKKRDSAYWLGRLKSEHPAIFKAFKKGTIRSVRAACVEAGLICNSTPISILQREWKKMGRRRRSEFLRWVRDREGVKTELRSLLTDDGHLSVATMDRVDADMAERRMKHAGVAEEMGLSRYSPVLGNVMACNYRPPEYFLKKLATWLARIIHDVS